MNRPDVLLGESNSITVNSTGEQVFPLINPVPVPDTTNQVWWAGFEVNSATYHQEYSSTSKWCHSLHTYGTGPSSMAGCVKDTNTFRIKIYYTEGTDAFVRVKIYDSNSTRGSLLGESASTLVNTNGSTTIPLTATVGTSGNVYGGFETLNDTLWLISNTFVSNIKCTVSHTYGTGPDPFGTCNNFQDGPFMGVTYNGPILDKINNLLSYYQFNSTSCNNHGTTFDLRNLAINAGSNVSLGTNADGTSSNSMSCNINGLIGKSYNFTSVSHNAVASDFLHTFGNGTYSYNWLHNGLQKYTSNIWLKLSSSMQGPTTFFNSEPNTGVSGQISATTGNNYFYYDIRNSANNQVVVVNLSNVIPQDKNWHMYTIECDPTTTNKTCKVWIDSILKGNGNKTGSSYTTSNSGINPAYYDQDGTISPVAMDEGSFWNVLLSQTNINTLYNGSHGYDLIRANSPSPTINISPSSGVIHTNVTATGTNYGSYKTVTIKFDGSTIATSPSTIITSTGGNWNATFLTPNKIPAIYTINATDNDSPHKSATSSYSMSSPNISVNDTAGIVGTPVSISGFNFLNSTQLHFSYFGINVTTNPSTVTSNSNGGFSGVIFNIPKAPAGINISHTINVTDGYNYAIQFFTIQPSLFLNPDSGTTSDIVTMHGNGFNSSQTITFKLDGSPITTNPVTVTTNSSGSFNNVNFTIPVLIDGSHTINATDTTNNSAIAILTINNTPTGGTLSITGMQAGNTVTIFPSITIIRPANVHINNLKLYQGPTLLETFTYTSPLLINANVTTDLESLIKSTTSNSTWTVKAEVTNATGTIIITSNGLGVNFFTGFNSSSAGFICPTGFTCVRGSVNGGTGGQTITNGTITHGGIVESGGMSPSIYYSYNRNSTFTGLTVTVVRNPAPWNLECKITTGLFGNPSWINVTQVGSFNRTVPVDSTTNYTWQCFGSGQILQFTSYGLSNGTAAFKTYTTNFGDFFGVPLPFLMVVMVAAIATGRSAPTMIIILGITFGCLIFFGLLTLSGPIYFVIVTLLVVCGALIGKKIF